ncbi:RHH-type transcriptional regulator [Steroidobacter denitrificans]|uniref:Bifunctional protein PutA n=1 Tax=Steroidobacter denitrificans TaxID=465721 RepID=A0A127FD79_STEDE|nr:RHH-type transcriptional regulator [Steroidobacter denitrificans]
MAALRAAFRSALYTEETQAVNALLAAVQLSQADRTRMVAQASRFVSRTRARKGERGVLEVFLQEYGLSSDEGIALLCLAEALLRVPDAQTADNLIAEKLRSGAWSAHRSQSDSTVVNAATRALMLSSGIVALDTRLSGQDNGLLRSLVNRLGEPVVRAATRQAMKIMGNEFVLGRTIEEALDKAQQTHCVASFDMLGEGARTAADAQRYFESYSRSIDVTAAAARGDVYAAHGVSVKLSALHPRYDYANQTRVLREMLPRLRRLALQACAGGISMTIDAEEAARLDLSLEFIEALARDRELAHWQGLGLAVQCYSKRAPALLDWLIALGRDTGRRFMLRLVKGAYWDTEIKRAQELGVAGYPVFTRKMSTDLCYLACARKALAHPEVFYPQFATHNAHTIAGVLQMAGERRDFEFQRLHGMGELLYSAVRDQVPDLPQVRVYAPVGAHRDLLAYLVRRLLENGANSSFVNRFMDERTAIERLVEDPVARILSLPSLPNPKIPLPCALYEGASAEAPCGQDINAENPFLSDNLSTRRNSTGLDLNDPQETAALLAKLGALKNRQWAAGPIVSGAVTGRGRLAITNPADHTDIVGHVWDATSADLDRALDAAVSNYAAWDAQGAEARAAVLERAADALEAGRERFLSLLVREAGKTVDDALAECREAVDFCRYYAQQARCRFGAAHLLPGPTGEQNLYSLHGRGAFVCISPWNFPLAIFLGQVTAALAAGNAVLAKPAEQTPLIAAEAIELLHRAGVPYDVLHLLPGTGEMVGAALVADERIAGAALTGSTATAKLIAKTLAARRGAIIPLIAETGGQNAMFVDSTALPEQVVDDVVRSAFHSAGQRCSALRVLYLQDEVADGIIEMLTGAMDELSVGDPGLLSTDVGPVIDEPARKALLAHVEALQAEGRLLHVSRLGEACARGTFVAPHLFEIDSIRRLEQEHFGPLLHVVRFRLRDLEKHLAQLRATGFGLTLGVHTRIEAMSRRIFDASMAGNVYVNRNMIGAVVGVQPFGGHGLSGTGPKAGGPLYLPRFAAERVLSVNTAATGGNITLLRLGDD